MATNGNDVLSTSADDEVLHGLGGDDTLTSTHNRTTLFGDDGDDDLNSTLVFSRFGIIEDGFLALAGNNGNDRIRAALGMVAANGTIIAEGGADDDDIGVHAFVSEPSPIAVDLVSKTYGGSGNDVIAAHVDLTGASGGSATVVADGGSGDDQIDIKTLGTYAGSANTHAITANGGTGNDVILSFTEGYYSGANTITNTLVGGAGNDHIEAFTVSISADGVATVRNELFGGAGDDVLNSRHFSVDFETAFDIGHELTGGAGNDRLLANTDFSLQIIPDRGRINHGLFAGAGDDYLESQFFTFTPSADVEIFLSGGSGNDTLIAQADVNNTDESRTKLRNTLEGGAGDDTIFLMTTFTSGSVQASAVLDMQQVVSAGSGNDSVNVLLGVNFAATDPNPTITLALGSTEIYGGSGDDTLSMEVALYQVDPGITVIGFGVLDGGAGADRLTMIGGSGNILDGGAGHDVLVGGDGDDTLIGGFGNDELTGGLGPDTFSFRLASGQDTIQDFQLGIDTFQLTGGQAIGSLQTQGADTRVLFGDGSSALLIGLTVSDPIALFP